MNLTEIVGAPIKIDNLEIAQNDFPEKMNFHDAQFACMNLQDRWRLPTKKELNLMYKNKEVITSNIFSAYWCSLDENNGFAWYIFFGNGKWTNFKKEILSDVRVVRGISN